MHADLPAAFLVHQNKIFIADSSLLTEPNTAVTWLIEAICSKYPNDSRRILRERIYSSRELTPLCQGMIKVAAKRASVLNAGAFRALCLEQLKDRELEVVRPSPLTQQQLEQSPAKFSSLEETAQYALSLAALSDRSVGAVLIDRGGALLHYGWNTNLDVRTQHAEMNLIRALAAKGFAKFPADAKLVVSLKPCAMCAAAILHFSNPAAPISVIYLKDDPGPKAKNSVLIKGSELWKKAGEPEIELTHFEYEKELLLESNHSA